MEIRNDLEPQFSPEINEDLMLLAWGFRPNSTIAFFSGTRSD
jgi:hypothetical protein